MGFLDNVALRKAERNLRPFMRTDERIIEYDIAEVAQLGRNLPVVLSNRAVYFLSDPAIRTPYAHILDLQARGPTVAFSTQSGNSFLIQIVGPPKGDIYDTIAHHLDKVIKHRQEIDVPGGTVTALCRQVEEDGSPVWIYMSSHEVQLDSPEVKSAIAVELSTIADRLGVPLSGV